ncbi:putative ubiquitin-like protein YukD [Pseudogracilibacillus auburnensis]|uniref:Putative ubiquitin-like protein YukD n=1 Tax=Pseudogracilibacillus auburnensis TaxID=1494959 RepID=A0A2V3VZ78_9BACI|nr:putative ubiquitin-like protein YukD [Pseudogracilibacillus auburnensis]
MLAKNVHINVTVDFTNWNDGMYDLRIPIQLTVKQLLLNLQETLEITMPESSLFATKIETKQLLLADDDSLIDYPVTDGDIIVVL